MPPTAATGEWWPAAPAAPAAPTTPAAVVVAAAEAAVAPAAAAAAPPPFAVAPPPQSLPPPCRCGCSDARRRATRSSVEPVMIESLCGPPGSDRSGRAAAVPWREGVSAGRGAAMSRPPAVAVVAASPEPAPRPPMGGVAAAACRGGRGGRGASTAGSSPDLLRPPLRVMERGKTGSRQTGDRRGRCGNLLTSYTNNGAPPPPPPPHNLPQLPAAIETRHSKSAATQEKSRRQERHTNPHLSGESRRAGRGGALPDTTCGTRAWRP